MMHETTEDVLHLVVWYNPTFKTPELDLFKNDPHVVVILRNVRDSKNNERFVAKLGVLK